MTATAFAYRNELPSDAPVIEALHEEMFPPGWKKRAAYVLREGVAPDLSLSFVVTVEGRLVGSVRMTPITIAGKPALILGPLIVRGEYAGQGAGRALVRMALAAARAAGHRVVLLVGDLPYYGPLGFTFLGRDVITLPAWVDPDRVLVAGLAPGALEGLSGRAASVRDIAGASPPTALRAVPPPRSGEG